MITSLVNRQAGGLVEWWLTRMVNLEAFDEWCDVSVRGCFALWVAKVLR